METLILIFFSPVVFIFSVCFWIIWGNGCEIRYKMAVVYKLPIEFSYTSKVNMPFLQVVIIKCLLAVIASWRQPLSKKCFLKTNHFYFTTGLYPKLSACVVVVFS